MTTVAALNKFVRDTAKVITSVPEAIRYYPNAPRPAGEYVSVNVAQLRKIGTLDKEYSRNVDDIDERIIMLYEAMVSVNFFRGESLQNAAILASSMRRESVTELMNAANIGITNVSEVRDLTQLIDHGHETRAQVDLFIQFELDAVDELITGIDIARIIGVIENLSGVIDNVNIEIEILRLLVTASQNENGEFQLASLGVLKTDVAASQIEFGDSQMALLFEFGLISNSASLSQQQFVSFGINDTLVSPLNRAIPELNETRYSSGFENIPVTALLSQQQFISFGINNTMVAPLNRSLPELNTMRFS